MSIIRTLHSDSYSLRCAKGARMTANSAVFDEMSSALERNQNVIKEGA